MPRASSVSEKVWAQAIHAVTVQKMSLRRAAQLYGVHHMSLHRRVRGRYMTTAASRYEDDFALTAAEEEEVVSVLREQFLHECYVSTDDVRYVVRTIASQDGRRDIPADFPVNRWISNFKRVHGFSTPGVKSPTASRGADANGNSTGVSALRASSSQQQQRDQIQRSSHTSDASFAASFSPRLPDMSRLSCSSAGNSPFHSAANGNNNNSNGTTAAAASTNGGSGSNSSSIGNGSSGNAMSYAAHNGSSTTGSSSNNSSNGYQDQRDSTSESESEHHRESHEREERLANDKRCRHSNVVSAETWEKAMDAVEVHGMSLRNAAKAYGVHFAALHRRVKKRALKKEQSPPLENYIPFEDEAGIVRVIHARADLGILMTWEELVDLLNRTALKYALITPESSRAIVRRFQSRVEQSIRHLIKDWPLPHFDSLYRLQFVAGEQLSSPPPMPVQLPALYPMQPPQYMLAAADPKPPFAMGNLSPLPPPPPPPPLSTSTSTASSQSQSLAQRSEQLQLRRQLNDDRSARLQL